MLGYDSNHITEGTAVILHGEANATYSVTADSTEMQPDPSDSILFAWRDLPLGMHNVTLILRDTTSDQMVVFWNAIITTSRLAFDAMSWLLS